MVRVLLRVDNVSQRKFFEILRSATFDFFTRSNGDFLKHLETEQKCRDQWNVSAWNQCSSGCGAPSVRRRHVTCKSSSCEGSKPKNLESCTRKCSYSWKKSPWVRVLAKLTLSCNFMRKTLNKVDLLWSMWGSLNTADYVCRKQSKCKFDLETGFRLSLDTFKSLKNHWRNLGAG